MFMMKNPTLECYTIKFLYNLSFDIMLCDEILKVGLLPKITELIGIYNKYYSLFMLEFLLNNLYFKFK